MTVEELQAELLKIQDQLKTVTDTNAATQKTLEEKEKRVKELEEFNQKLFIRATAKVEDTKEDKEEIPEYLDEKTFKLLDKKDKNLLKEIEGEE